MCPTTTAHRHTKYDTEHKQTSTRKQQNLVLFAPPLLDHHIQILQDILLSLRESLSPFLFPFISQPLLTVLGVNTGNITKKLRVASRVTHENRHAVEEKDEKN
jgi:hypothetical protein